MPSSITSAPACGSALRIASEVSPSGSPAVTNVTSAARPSCLRSAKRRSMRVVMGCAAGWTSIRQPFAFALAYRGEPDIRRAEHQDHDRADELNPFLLLQHRTRRKQPGPQEICDEGRRHDHQDPADELL